MNWRTALALLSGRRGSNSRPIAWKAIALSTELLPQKYTVQSQLLPTRKREPFATPTASFKWEEMDSNHRRRAPADLQSAPFGHSGIFPIFADSSEPTRIRADGGIRTPDQLITNQLLWPTELHRRLTFSGCKGTNIFLICKFFCNFFQKNFRKHSFKELSSHPKVDYDEKSTANIQLFC